MPALHPRPSRTAGHARPAGPARPARLPDSAPAARPVRLRAVLTLLALPVLLLPAAAPRAAADDGPGWTAEPATGASAAAARPSFYLAGPAGTVLEDRLALANPSDREHTVTLRGADAHNTPAGAFAVRPAAGSAGAGSWISFGAAATVRIPPHTRAVVPFTVTVPPGAAPGDHPAAVVAAEAGREVGVRVDLRVGGPTLAALTVEDVSVHGRGTRTEVAYTLVNRGNVTLAPELALRVGGLLGRVPGRAAHPLPVELLPGQRVRLTEPWPGAPAAGRVDLTLAATAPGAAPATATASAWLLPRGAVVAGAGPPLLAGLALAARRLVRRRRRPGPPDGAPAGPFPPARPAPPVPEDHRAPGHELTGAAT
ncbi:hypothetical protein AB0953_10275 [Streptomyces sp. NPDC046866]|uniref:COG1470 family protein n=1 Tax=Streptomyces sp. NPDC046866 TaxID=3154921 RepID=UPI003451EE85